MRLCILQLIICSAASLVSACGPAPIKDTRHFAGARISQPSLQTGWQIDLPTDNEPILDYSEDTTFEAETAIDFVRDENDQIESVKFVWNFPEQSCALGYHFLVEGEGPYGLGVRHVSFNFESKSKVREASIELAKLGLKDPNQILPYSDYWQVDCGANLPPQLVGYSPEVTLKNPISVTSPQHKLSYVRGSDSLELKGLLSLHLPQGYSCDFRGLTYRTNAEGGLELLGYNTLPSPLKSDAQNMLEFDIANDQSGRWKVNAAAHILEKMSDLKLEARCLMSGQRVIKIHEITVSEGSGT
jgi:hypothetical protein